MLRSNEGKEELAPYKWIRHRSKTKSGLTIRGGLARSVTWTFLFKHFTISDWAIFCEAYGQPLRLGKFGPGATDDQKQILLQAVQNIGTDFAAIVPDSMAIEFVEASIAGSHELYERRADWLDRQVSKIVLGQTQTTDAQAGGYAVGKVHDGVREDIERADAKQLGATINRDLVRPIVDLNHGPQKKYPKVKIGRPDEIDIDKLVTNVTKLVPLGLKVGASTMRDKLSLPDPDPKEEVLQPERKSSPEGQTPPLANADRSAHSATQPKTSDQDAIDRTVSDIVDDEWEELVAPMLGSLEDKIAKAVTIDDARKILAEHFLTMDTGQFAKRLAEASFGARLAGLYDEQLDGNQ
jgi:phage gp29-like protein